MIFAAVGSMFPFDRFVRAVDLWASANPAHKIFVQIGGGDYKPRSCDWAAMIPMDEYRDRLQACELFVSHVGMGAILQGLEQRKQMVLFPRRRELGEVTTDHQLHTAEKFSDIAGVRIARDEASLHAQMTSLIENPIDVAAKTSDHASPALLTAVASFLASASKRPA